MSPPKMSETRGALFLLVFSLSLYIVRSDAGELGNRPRSLHSQDRPQITMSTELI